ncbi:MAG TPA: 16S rRNA (cytosine(967)-C(5))-methyltransferase RsmB [Candidatus Eisenbacteria bacterium]|jgi:16S rRNA (cytosine967-C5)-methyltransferase|nr:16S rRNA (cytosine(967)-C(5))-methyltransferase RsmB [Candidatus Eisenbacteria bacterium]
MSPGRRPPPRTRRKAGAREIALQILLAVETRRAYSDRVLETKLREAALSPVDAALVTTLVQGSIRTKALLDHHLEHLTRGGWERLPGPIRAALRIGAYQVLVLTRIPASAAVHESVELAKRYGHPGTAGLANAVLRRLAAGERAPLPDRDADPEGYLAIVHSHPRWLVARWLARYGMTETEQLLAADNREPSVSVRANAHRIRTAELAKLLRAEGIESKPGPNGGPVLVLEGGFVASRSPLFRDGLLSLQDEAEASVPGLLDIKAGDRALDLCAAPGGKASQMAERVAPGGRLTAVEIQPGRARALRENLVHRLRLPGVDVILADGRTAPFDRPFDGVLLDAPCTGLGVLRRRADARWRKEESDIATMAALQSTLLDRAAALTRPGGVLVYSVCSLEPEETDRVVASFLERTPAFRMEDARPHLPSGFASDEPVLRATPHRHDTDGVFAARLRRR